MLLYLNSIPHEIRHLNKFIKALNKLKHLCYDTWDSSRENDNSHLYIKCYTNASRLNRYIFRTVKAINILLSTLHTTPFLYGKICFGVLHLLRASIATFDTPPGSNPPYLSVEVIKSLQIRFVGGEVLYLSICSVR